MLHEIADAEREIAQQQERRAQLVEAIGTATGDDAETYRELRNEVDGVIDAEERRLEVLLAELLALDDQAGQFEEIVGIIGRLADIQFGAENPAFEGLARLAQDSRDLDAVDRPRARVHVSEPRRGARRRLRERSASRLTSWRRRSVVTWCGSSSGRRSPGGWLKLLSHSSE